MDRLAAMKGPVVDAGRAPLRPSNYISTNPPFPKRSHRVGPAWPAAVAVFDARLTPIEADRNLNHAILQLHISGISAQHLPAEGDRLAGGDILLDQLHPIGEFVSMWKAA